MEPKISGPPVLRGRLHEYVVARKKAEKKNKPTESRVNNNNRSYPHRPQDRTKSNGTPGSKVKANSWNHTSITTGSAEALVANNKQNPASRHYDQCRHCAKRHWSDEYPQYQTINERKQQLKDSCFRCLKVGHVSKECKQNKMCVHCGEFNIHHRSLCPKKFRSKISNVHLSEERSDCVGEIPENQESVLVSSGETVLMQTASKEVKNTGDFHGEHIRILLDSGSQRTYVTEQLADRLGLARVDEQEIKLVTFGCKHPKTIKTTTTKLDIILKSGKYLTISAHIVPVISSNIYRKPVTFRSKENLRHLVESLDMADTISLESESSSVELLLGNDYYLDIILSHKIELQPGFFLLS